MRKQLLALSAAALLVSWGSLVYAENLDADTIKTIHEGVKKGLIDKCKTKMVGATDKSCACLGDKAEKSLDDEELGKCANNESGGPCITAAVSAATTKGLSAENISACAPTPSAVTTTKSSETTTTAPAQVSDDAAAQSTLPPAVAPDVTPTAPDTVPTATSSTTTTTTTAPSTSNAVTGSSSSSTTTTTKSSDNSSDASVDAATAPDDDEYN